MRGEKEIQIKVREKSSGDTAQKTLGDIFNCFVKIVKELPG